MVAAITPLPVVGVPVKSSALSGNDSLLSIVQVTRVCLCFSFADGRVMSSCPEPNARTPVGVARVDVFPCTRETNSVVAPRAQMPKGVPVATVAIGNAANAGALARNHTFPHRVSSVKLICVHVWL